MMVLTVKSTPGTVSLIHVPKNTRGQSLNDSKLLNMKINNKQKEMRYIYETIQQCA